MQGRHDQRRATEFRTRNQTNRVIELLDAHGSKRVIRKQGKMGLTKHNNILSALEMRASRYHNKGQNKIDMNEVLYNKAIDETGTVATENLSDSDADSYGDAQIEIQASMLEIEEISGVADKILEVHGVAPEKKAEGASRLIYENMDGLNNRIPNNEKLEKATEIIDDLEADLVAYSEHKMRIGHKLNRNGMSQMFNGGESEVRSVVSSNVHEKGGGRTHQGETSMLMFGSLIDQYDFESSGKDDTGLGRWVYMAIRGDDGIHTRVVCGYNPCGSPKKVPRSSYQQQRRYFIIKEKDHTCPRKRFREDLMKQLTTWRRQGDMLIDCMDVNEDDMQTISLSPWRRQVVN